MEQHLPPQASPEDRQALQDLQREATDPTELEHLDDIRADLGVTMANLGQNAVERSELVQLDTGEVVAREAVEREQAEGRSVHNGPYTSRA